MADNVDSRGSNAGERLPGSKAALSASDAFHRHIDNCLFCYPPVWAVLNRQKAPTGLCSAGRKRRQAAADDLSAQSHTTAIGVVE